MYNPTRQQIIRQWEQLPDILREAMHSSLTIDEIDSAENSFHLGPDRANKLARLVRGVFYGLIHTEDLYKEIKDSLQIDPRLALDIYHELDKKIFDSYRKEIEDNYIKYKIGAIKESEITPSRPVSPQVVLKEDSEVINLKPQSESTTSTKLRVEGDKSGEPAPMIIGQANVESETKINVPAPKDLSSFSEIPVSNSKPEITTKQKLEAATSKPAGISEGPMIIHKKEESQSIAQSQASSPFRQTSFGGYMGAFRSFSGQAPQSTVSSARIEIPSDQKVPSNAGEQKIPVIVKKYEEQSAKTVHYSDLRTPISVKKDDKKPSSFVAPVNLTSPPPKESSQDMIDLNNLTFKK